MSQRVLATPTAVNAIKQLQALLAGQFQTDVQKLKQLLQELGDAQNWDGPMAQQFRQSAPAIEQNASKMVQDLEDLRARAGQIVQAIMAAGGVAGGAA